MPGLVLVLVPDAPRYTIIAASNAYLEATQTRRDDLLGRGLFEHLHDNSTAPAAITVRELAGSLARVLRHRTSDAIALPPGDAMPEAAGDSFEQSGRRAVNSPVIGADGELTYIIHRIEDVTEHMLALRAALSIERALLDRTAQRAIQARDDVLGIVAHDLRNPLNAIVMQSALIRVMDGEAQRLTAAERIERAASRMSRLIEDLLDVSLIEAGRLSMAQAHVDVGNVVSDAVESQKSLVTSASLDLSLDVERELPAVWADRERLLQVFENLIGNAAKFSQPGDQIVVGAERRAGEVLFRVTDTGAGIAPEDLTHLFDRFWQAQRAKRRGAGLGLPIVKGIVDAHGGRIWVDSELGSGSTVFFTIPTAPHPELHRDLPAPPAS